ncbi:hypothetical protein QOT17_005802 [Balamuthia mandrillaris]
MALQLGRFSLRLWALLVLAVVLFFAQGITAQTSGTCVPFEGKPILCSQYIEEGTPIFIPDGLTQEWLQTFTSQYINPLTVYANGELQRPCRASVIPMSCATSFRPCVQDAQGNYLPIPEQTCNYNCAQFMEICAPLYEKVLVNTAPGKNFYLPYNFTEIGFACNVTSEYSPIPLFPEGNYSQPIDNNGTTVEVECNRYSLELQLLCADPLQRVDASCVFVCPLPSLTDEEYDAVQILQSLFGWLSYLGSLFIIASYFLHPKLRTFPSNMVAMTCLSAHISAFAFILPTFAGYKEVWCGGDEEAYTSTTTDEHNGRTQDYSPDYEELSMSSPLCTFQGVVLQYGFETGTFWWCLIAVNMAVQLIWGAKKTQNKRLQNILQIVYHILAWGIPALLVLIPLAADKFYFEASGTFCFVSSEHDLAWQLSVWFIPVALLLFVGTICFSISMFMLLRLTFIAGNNSKQRFNTCIVYLRLILFVSVFLLIYAFIFAHRIVISSNKSAIEDTYREYYNCLFMELSDCKLGEDARNFPLVLLRALAYSTLGFCLFFVFFNMECLYVWRTLFFHLIRGEFTLSGLRSSTSSAPGSHSRRRGKGGKKANMLDTTMSDLGDDDQEERS